MKAVIYARYSCDNQREESIEGQLRECLSFADRKDIQSSKPMQTEQYPERKPKIVRNFSR